MDAIEQLQQDAREGRVGLERLLDVIVTLQRQLAAARQRIEELEKNAANPPAADGGQGRSAVFPAGRGKAAAAARPR